MLPGLVEGALAALGAIAKGSKYLALFYFLRDLWKLWKKVKQMKKFMAVLRFLAKLLNWILAACEWLLARLPAFVHWLRGVLKLLPEPEAEESNVVGIETKKKEG